MLSIIVVVAIATSCVRSRAYNLPVALVLTLTESCHKSCRLKNKASFAKTLSSVVVLAIRRPISSSDTLTLSSIRESAELMIVSLATALSSIKSAALNTPKALLDTIALSSIKSLCISL